MSNNQDDPIGTETDSLWPAWILAIPVGALLYFWFIA